MYWLCGLACLLVEVQGISRWFNPRQSPFGGFGLPPGVINAAAVAAKDQELPAPGTNSSEKVMEEVEQMLLTPEGRWWLGIRGEDQTWVSRVQEWHRHHKENSGGFLHFFESAMSFEWGILLLFLGLFVLLHLLLFDWPSSRRFHALALLIWFAAAAVFGLVISWRMERLGMGTGGAWTTGYFLEFVFSIENVFIYHIVTEAFQVPRKAAQKALFIVVCCQVVFQMVFFMGLANFLQSIHVLPYFLGIWLLYVGCHSLREGDHSSFNAKESNILTICQAILGQRLWPGYREDNRIFFDGADGRRMVTMLFPATICLLLVDFVMEIDVTLTKIEELDNHYISFTSSVAAAFAVPELFFVARDLFKRFHLLKYGVSFVLLFFGLELLLGKFIHVPDALGMLIIAVVMLLCVLLSWILRKPNDVEESEAENQSKTVILDPHLQERPAEVCGEKERAAAVGV